MIEIPSRTSIERYLEAYRQLRDGNTADYDEIAAESLALVTDIALQEAALLRLEGTSKAVYATDSEGKLVLDEDEDPTLLRMVANPRSLAVADFFRLLGFTGADQLYTPRSQKRAPKGDSDRLLQEVEEGAKVLLELKKGHS